MISNKQDVIDSREIIEELKNLEDELEFHIEEGGTEENFIDIDDLEELREWNNDGKDYIDDWEDGVTLVHENSFEKYAKECFFELYDIPEDISTYIDWESWTNDLEMDYTSIDLSGETYYIR